ncbi:MAG: glutathione S-transferase N-terminal domain-containing protein [Deltaproteobacteria bacterium]|nr:glutathione S-transferase N-terminal domain-containing protein [Deltaproteobacteria bacterium]
MTPPLLLHLPYSPWSERARWALDARAVAHKRRTYQPLLGEPELRVRLRRWTGPVSVPVLLTDDKAIADSDEIARWADQRGSGSTLFPDEHAAAIDHWIRRSQEGLAAGRAVSLIRVLASPEACVELTPPWMRKLGPVARAVGRSGVARTRKKYSGDARADAEHQKTLEGVLDELRTALGPSPTTLLGTFTYADICAAQVLCFVKLPDRKYLRLGKASAEAVGDPELATRYRDVVEWRDALYAKYRERS